MAVPGPVSVTNYPVTTVTLLKEIPLHLQLEGDSPTYRMEVLRGSRTVLDRLVWEGNLILGNEETDPGCLMNGRGEWGKNKMVRFGVTTRRT